MDERSVVGSLKFIVDIPALVINGLITWLCYVGLKESKNFNNSLVILKLAVIVLVILVVNNEFNTANWTPLNPETGVTSFMPNGFCRSHECSFGSFLCLYWHLMH